MAVNKSVLNKSVSFDGCYDTGEELYASCMQFNALLKINKRDGRVQLVTTFPNEPAMQQAIYQKIYCADDNVIFVPSYGKGVYTYDLQNQQLEFYPITMPDCAASRCIASYQVGDKIWMFYAYADNPIVVYDIKTHQIEYYEEMMKVLPEEIRERKKAVFWGEFACNESDVYGVIWKSAYILHMNLQTMAVEIISLCGWADELTGVAYDAGVIYLTEFDSKEVKALRLLDGARKVYRPQGDMQLDEEGKMIYSNVIACQGEVLMIPDSGRRIFSLRHEDGMIVPFADLPEAYEDVTDERRGWRRYFSHFDTDSGIRLCPSRANMMLDINVSERTIRGQIYRFDENADEAYFKHNVCGHLKEQALEGEICENEAIGLEDFLKYVTFISNN